MDKLLQYNSSWNLIVFACLLLLVWLQTWRFDESRIRHSAKYWPLLYLAILTIVSFTIIVGCAPALVEWEQTPLTISKLLGHSPQWTAFGLTLGISAIGTISMALGRLWRRKPVLYAILFLPLVVAVSLTLGFNVVSFSDSSGVRAIIGDNQFPWAWPYESTIRFAAVIALLISLFSLGCRISEWEFGRWFWIAVPLPCLAAIGFGWFGSITANQAQAASLLDRSWLNLSIAIAFLPCLGILVGRLAQRLSWGLRGEGLFLLSVVLSFGVSIPLTWQFLVFCGNSAIEGEAELRTAHEVIIRPSADQSVSENKLLGTYVYLHLYVLHFLVLGATLSDLLLRKRAWGRKNPKQKEIAPASQRQLRQISSGKRHKHR